MIQTIRIAASDPRDDLRGAALGANIRTARVYRVEGVDAKTAKVLAEKLFCEKINQKYTLNSKIFDGKVKSLEIAYKPGVMNPEVASIIKACSDLGIKVAAADSSTEFYFFGKARNLKLFNPIVEYIVDSAPTTLKISGRIGKTTRIPIRKASDGELMSLSRDKLFLNLEEMKVIQSYFQKIKRDPTDVELETLAQTWSEHCAHKTFKANLIVDGRKKSPLISRIKREALKHKKLIVSAFVDNSGVMDFYDGWSICGKVETHNSPSAIEPYGGATTGSGGVFRDVAGTGQGAKNIASTDIFCFANPQMTSKLPPGCLAPDYLLKRVVTGVRDYGNRMGIPTNNGSVHFHDDFRAKPTVIVGAYGLLPKKRAQKGQVKNGDLVLVIGGRTGRDGIHGATFASGEMTERTINVNSQAVQIGNAIEEKRMFDAILEARDEGLIRAIQDCGAGGFSSAIGEMGEKVGVRVDLSSAPLKYQGLSPWEIWVSESQERMIVAIAPKNLKKFMEICQKYNVEATVLGKFGAKSRLQIFYGREKVADLDMKFLHHGLPQRVMVANKVKSEKLKVKSSSQKFQPKAGGPLAQKLKSQKDWETALKRVLASGDVCSKEPIVRLYDHTVQGTNALEPFVGEFLDGPSDAAIIRPILSKPYGMVISHGLNPALNNTDPYWGSVWAAVEALSNYVAVGGDFREASLINNYIWPFPDEESLWSLDKSVDAVVDIMRTFKIPVISGKDSLSSTYRGSDGKIIKIPPVLCISVFGRIPDVSKTATSDFKKVGSTICLVGQQDLSSLVPKPDLKTLPKLFAQVTRGIRSRKILACHDVSEGGLITTIFEMCVGGAVGSQISIPKDVDAYGFLFNEIAGCFIVEVENKEVAPSLFKNVDYKILGKTSRDNILSVKQNDRTLLSSKIEPLKKVWKEPMRKHFQ